MMVVIVVFYDEALWNNIMMRDDSKDAEYRAGLSQACESFS